MTIKSESQRYSKHLNPVPKNDFEHSLMLKERAKNEGFHILKNIKKDQVKIENENKIIYNKLCRFKSPGLPSTHNKYSSDYCRISTEKEWQKLENVRNNISK